MFVFLVKQVEFQVGLNLSFRVSFCILSQRTHRERIESTMAVDLDDLLSYVFVSNRKTLSDTHTKLTHTAQKHSRKHSAHTRTHTHFIILNCAHAIIARAHTNNRYSTLKIVTIRDRRLGFLHYGFQLAILAYIVGMCFLY